MRSLTRYYKLSVSLLLLVGFTGYAFSQDTLNLTGTVTNIVTNEPLQGINVSVEGESGYFTTTDAQGSYTLEIPSQNVSVVFSYPRYNDYSIYVGNKSSLSIKMVPVDYSSDLEYLKLPTGDKQKRLAVESAETLEDEYFRQRGHGTAEHFLYGQVAGLNVTAYNGSPGAGASLVLRGLNTIQASNQPLYIIDGVEINHLPTNVISIGAENSQLIYLTPEDIESLTVLKDATAKGIYGSRAANGVIMINTYAGQKGNSTMDFTFNTGISQIENYSSLLNSELNRAYLTEMNTSKYNYMGPSEEDYTNILANDTASLNYQKYNNSSDWPELVKENGNYQNYHFRLRGGDDVSKYSFSVGLWDQQGNVMNTDMNRLNARFNLDYKISEKFRYGNNISFSLLKQNRQFQLDSEHNPVLQSLRKSPITTPYLQDFDGIDKPVLEDYDAFGISNPLALAAGVKNENDATNINGRIYGEFLPNKNFSVYTEVALSQITQQEKVFIPALGVSPVKDLQRSSAQTYDNNLYLTGKLETRFNKKFKVKHDVSAVLGSDVRNNQLKHRLGRSYNSSSDDFTSLNQGVYNDTLASGTYDWFAVGFYLNANYAYKQKYIVTATVRVDGSSRFGANNRYVVFPVGGVAWRLDQENFLSGTSWIDVLKLRASFGYTGNDHIGNYTSQLLYIPANYKNLGGISLGQLINEDLKPEITRETNVGIDWSIFNRHLSISVDGYNNVNTNMLVNQNVPLETGFSYVTMNAGKVRNQGIETSINLQMRTGDLYWGIGGNIAYNQNEVLELPEKTPMNVSKYGSFVGAAAEGQALGSYYGYKTEGVFATAEEAATLTNGDGYTFEPFQAGDIKFADLNADGVIDENDQTFLGKASPDLYGGFWASVAYKGIALNILFDMQQGRQVINGTRYKLESMSDFSNQSMSTEDRWREEGDVTEMPRLAYKDPAGNSRFSDRWVEDGSFIRLRNVKLSYDLPGNLVNKMYLKKLMIFVSADNLFTITDYEGADPEFNHLANPLLSGVDLTSAPMYRTFSFGIQIGL